MAWHGMAIPKCRISQTIEISTRVITELGPNQRLGRAFPWGSGQREENM